MLQAPTSPYNGITIVLSRPSRFDLANKRLLSGPARFFIDEILKPINSHADECEIRTVEYSNISLRSGTTKVVLCGEEAQSRTGYHGLDAHRGLCEPIGLASDNGNIYRTATYAPQDCCDLFNVDDDDDDEEDAGGSNKDTAPTAFRNRRFWARRDWEKILNPQPLTRWDTDPRRMTVLECEEFPKLQGQELFLDIETHPPTNTVSVVGFAINDGPVYSLPVYDYLGRRVISEDEIYALARLLSRNKLILHNAAFDLPFLAIYCHLPFSHDIEDTMLMWHRMFPEAEKSLAHVMSYFLNARYHKSEGFFFPRNMAQQDALYRYNAKDVEATRAIYRAMREAADLDFALTDSFNDVNAAIYPYLLMGLRGLEVDTSRRRRYRKENQIEIDHLQRLLDILIGSPINVGSNQQCVNYFHKAMHYAPVKKSEKTGAPSLAGDALYKLLLKHNNPVIPVMLAIRKRLKSNSMLDFKGLHWPTKR